MTRRDEVIRMARECGMEQLVNGQMCSDWRPEIERFYDMVSAAKQERCAKVCEDRGNRMRAAAGYPNGDRDEFYCADDIRALKDEVGG